MWRSEEVPAELRRAYDAVDWAATPLGAPEAWSPALRGAVDLVLHTRFPATLLWGPEFVLVYNDAYVELIGEKHPAALGARAAEVFAEAWEQIGPLLRAVRDGGAATYLVDAAVPLVRHVQLEECYFTFSYSPVRDGDGTTEGVLDIAAESTAQVLGSRRLALLTRLAVVLADAADVVEVLDGACDALRAEPRDFARVDLVAPEAPPVPAAARAGRPAVDGAGADRRAWVPVGPGVEAVVRVGLHPELVVDEAYYDVLGLVGSLVTQALLRVAGREAERGLSEALQRSLLTEPVLPVGLDVAVRYRPSDQAVRIGGDWYDAFTLPDGPVVVVVGDVAGHDRDAAAAMAQVRNVLRGVAITSAGGPAEALAGLDRAMQVLDVGAFATAVVAQLEAAPAADGARALRFANAGHPPPVVLRADGRAELLRRRSELVVGLGAPGRTDHEAALRPGDALVLFTDGLVERRGVRLDVSLEVLARRIEGLPATTAGVLADALVDELEDAEDDVVVLVLRVPEA